MKTNVVRNLIYAQVSFFGCLTIAVLMTTRAFTNNYGLSFYGSNYPMVIPFVIGLILCNVFLLRASSQLPAHTPPFNKLQPVIRFLAILLLMVAATPDAAGPVFYDIHIIVAPILFGTQMILMLWLASRWNGDIFTWCLLTIQFLAGIVVLLSQLHITHYLGQGSFVFQLTFGLAFIWTVSRLVSAERQLYAADSA